MAGGRSGHPWHALFAPFPEGATARRHPVASPDVLATPEGAAIAGWTQIVLDLSAGANGLRVAMVVLDAEGTPISASDMVLRRSERAPREGEPAGETVVEFDHESVGGRLEPDGTFLGTRWHTTNVETESGEEIGTSSTRLAPSESDIAGLRAVVAELLRRAGAARA